VRTIKTNKYKMQHYWLSADGSYSYRSTLKSYTRGHFIQISLKLHFIAKVIFPLEPNVNESEEQLMVAGVESSEKQYI
jgi:hypothetical protein